jgi:hypothetical protein
MPRYQQLCTLIRGGCVRFFISLITSVNKRQTTVTIYQILTQKWFLLQNIKYLLLNLTFIMMFSITVNGRTTLLPVCPSFGKNVLNLDLYRRYVQNVKSFFDLTK